MKLVFIYSVNINGQTPAYGMVQSHTIKGGLKFQNGLREAMGPEWEVEFISADLNSEEPVEGDVTVVRQFLANFLKQEQYADLVILPEDAVFTNNYSAIRRKVLNALIK